MKKINCPKCGVNMDFVAESESSSSFTRIVRYYYRCPACGSKINDSNIIINKESEGIIIRIQQ
jgi:C4-type Zn-finger protein